MSALHGRRDMVGHGSARRGVAWQGAAGEATRGGAWFGQASCGQARQAGHDSARHAAATSGRVGRGRHGEEAKGRGSWGPAAFFRDLFGFGSVVALRARAARIDADFEKREHRASSELSAIRYRNAIEASERLLDAPAPAHATGPCLLCLEAVPGSTR